jgi:tRNA (Thr-GGU) A37 N-methylase
MSNKKKRGQENKKYKDARKELELYNQEMEKLKSLQDFDRLPVITYNKEGGFYVIE